MMFELDLVTLIQVLREYQYTGTLYAKRQDVAGIKGQFFIKVEFRKGSMVSCFLQRASGERLSVTNRIFESIAGLGNLLWQVDVLVATQGEPEVQKSAFSRVPRLRNFVEPTQMQAWPRQYRMVYTLINGQRTVEQIADLLSYPTSKVEEVLRNLEAKSLIFLE